MSTDRNNSDAGRVGSVDFIRAKVARDLDAGRYSRAVMTRFPPEPNGFLHIGHAKSIVLNFGIAAENEGGKCNVRFDDTNPITEEEKYAKAIQEDVRWLGYDWEDRLYYASDYFEQFYEFAVKLVREGKAYVDSLSEAEIREYRGTVTEPGRNSPYRDRSVDENLDLLERMKNGEFEDGAHVLRAKTDMAAPNMLMRDPLLYRIRHAHHYRRGDEWCIYPMYDYAHCLEDAIEGVTHSLCTLEFKDNRALYDWVLENVGFEEPPEQTEFARLNLDYTVLSKRKLVRLVSEGHVEGWDDPRMPTIAGLRRRGVTPEAIRNFCEMIGVAKVDSRVDIGKLEYSIRNDLNLRVPRVLSVLNPLKVVLLNYPEGETEWLDAPYYPHDVPKDGSRRIPFSRELYIERDDFKEDPPKKFFRLAPDREVRLRYAYYIKCVDVVRDPDTREILELHCTYDPETKGGGSPDGRKVKGTLHWVSAQHSLSAEVRLYDRLFNVPDPDDVAEGSDFTSNLNPDSFVTLSGCRIEPSVGEDPAGTRYQFERLGYFVSDGLVSAPERLVFNRTVGLRDTWAKIADSGARPASAGKKEGMKASSVPSRSETKAGSRPRVKVGTDEARARLSQLTEEHGLERTDAEVLAEDPELAEFFLAALEGHSDPRTVANWVINDLRREAKARPIRDLPFTGVQFGELIGLVAAEIVSRSAAKDVLVHMVRQGGDPEQIVREKGLERMSGDAVEVLVDAVLDAHGDEVKRYLDGNANLLGFFIGQVMKESAGKADPGLVGDLLRQKLQ